MSSYHESSHERLCQIVDEQERQIAELTRERDEARAIIERLPKTADGVPMAIGDSVFVVETQMLVAVGAFAVVARGEVLWSECLATTWRHGYDCYSTREAAEQARAKCRP